MVKQCHETGVGRGKPFESTSGFLLLFFKTWLKHAGVSKRMIVAVWDPAIVCGVVASNGDLTVVVSTDSLLVMPWSVASPFAVGAVSNVGRHGVGGPIRGLLGGAQRS